MATQLASNQQPWLQDLNERQRQAVEHDGGPLLILAGAGTGKTRTLVARVARLIDSGTDPARILLVTFSRRAATEMTQRVGHMIGAGVARQVNAGTFHAVANRLLRIYGSALRLPPGFSVLDQSDTGDMMGFVRNELGYGKRKRFPRKETLASIYSRVVNTQLPLKTVLETSFPWCSDDDDGIRTVFDTYIERKRAQDVLDYDDLLVFWRAACRDPALGPVLGDLYDHVLVDEYQDTNVLQADILLALRTRNPNITVVGDDAQSIYSFRAATVRNILDFSTHFPNSTTITLDENYRSTQPILDIANTVISDAHEQFSKELWSAKATGVKPILATCDDERSQCDAVCTNILSHLENGTALREQVVLFRAAHHSDVLEIELSRRNIPFVKFGGLKFLEAAHVRDLISLLRILDNPFDELAWFRVLQLVEHVGSATAQRIIETIGIRPRDESTPDPLVRFIQEAQSLVPKAKAELQALADGLEACRGDVLSPAVQVERLRQTIEPMLRRRYDNAEVRLADIEQLGNLATDYQSRSRLVSELTLDPPTSTGDLAGPPSLDDDYLTLSTVHSAKGGEWNAVHVIHAADGMFPSDLATRDAESIDEERRLFYVALTRARQHLHIYAPLRYHHAGKGFSDAHSYAQRTRFLPSSLNHLLDVRAVRSAHLDEINERIDLPVFSQSVDDSLRALWG